MAIIKMRRTSNQLNCLNSCVSGTVIPLEQVNDSIFSMKILGEGYGVIPGECDVYPPSDGYVTDITNNGRAVVVTTDNGLKLFIHFGVNLCDMNKNPLKITAGVGERIKCDNPIANLNCSACTLSGFEPTICVIISNSERLKNVKVLCGTKEHGEPALEYTEE
jgi:phosphotransferase system IIA component